MKKAKKILSCLLIWAILLSLLPMTASAAVTVTSQTTVTLTSGVKESAVKVSSGHNGFMIQVAPNAKASFRVSYPGYYTAGSTAESRGKTASSLPGAKATVMAQADAFEAATGRDVIFATNGNFFWGDTLIPMGGIMAEGNVIHPQDENAKIYFARLKDGSYAIRSYTEDTSDVAECVAGRQWLVRKGVKQSQNTEQISARTMVGLKADGTVVVFCLEGKTNVTGITLNEACELMYSLGCVDAVNLDGGGSTTFATQRSNANSMTIRNVLPDSTGERAVMSALMLVEEPDADHLFFDFTNDASAKARYATNLYGGLNYDTGNWHYNHSHDAAPVFNNTAGTMTVKKVAYNEERSIHTVITSSNTSYSSGHPLAFVPGKEDYVQVRMKITGSPDKTASFHLRFATDDSNASTNIAYTAPIAAEHINSGQFFTITGKLSAAFGKYDLITAIRPEIFDLTVPAKATGLTVVYDYIYVGPESKLPAPHQYQAVVTPPTCTKGGFTTYTCAVCGKTYTADTTPAAGHSYDYRDNGAEHTATCTACGDTYSEPHSYTDGLCICGISEGPILDESITINHTLNLASDIAVSFVVAKEQLADYDSFLLECRLEDDSLVTVEPVLNGNYYYFTLTGMTAVRMKDEIRATLRMQKNERDYYSPEDIYSIAQYAYTALSKDSTPDSLKRLCADLLRYGAAAQLFKNYRTDRLADKDMTAEQQAYLRDLETVSFGNTNEEVMVLPQPPVTWVGKTLNLESKVTLKYVIDTSAYTGALDELSLQVTYADYAGEPKTVVISRLTPYSEAKGWYAFDFDGLLAAELRTVISASIYQGSTQISNILRYSPDTYGKGTSDPLLLRLCQALYAYSDSASAFFTQKVFH